MGTTLAWVGIWILGMALGDPGAGALGRERKAGSPAQAGDGAGDRAALKARVGQGRSVRVDLRLAGRGEPRERIKVVSVPDGIEAALGSDGTLLIHAGYNAPKSATISVDVTSDSGKTSPLTVELEIAPLRWLPRLTWEGDRGPESREHGAFVIDEPRGRVLLRERGLSCPREWVFRLTPCGVRYSG